jgi:hypothetical protein
MHPQSRNTVLVSLAAIIVCSVCVYTAVRAYGQAGQALVTITIQPLDDNRAQGALHNWANSAVTAYAYTTSSVAHPTIMPASITQHDTAIEPGVGRIFPGQDLTVMLGRFLPPDTPNATFRAALFQDGSAYGDPVWVTSLRNRRTYYAQSLATAASDLSALAQKAPDPQSLFAQLKQQMQARMAAVPTVMSQISDLSDRALVLQLSLDHMNHVSMLSFAYPLPGFRSASCTAGAAVSLCAQLMLSGIQNSESLVAAAIGTPAVVP